MSRNKLKTLTLWVCSIVIGKVFGQTIPIEKAREYIGDSVTVCSKVYGTKIITNINGDTLTLINLGAAYPNQLLTIIIKPGCRKKFSYKPEEFLKTKNICVSGVVVDYMGGLQIELKDESHITHSFDLSNALSNNYE